MQFSPTLRWSVKLRNRYIGMALCVLAFPNEYIQPRVTLCMRIQLICMFIVCHVRKSIQNWFRPHITPVRSNAWRNKNANAVRLDLRLVVHRATTLLGLCSSDHVHTFAFTLITTCHLAGCDFRSDYAETIACASLTTSHSSCQFCTTALSMCVCTLPTMTKNTTLARLPYNACERVLADIELN